jgi:ferredoxin--NADP+ reductase
MEAELEKGTPRHRARLKENRLLTAPNAAEEIRELIFTIDDENFAFQPGQSIAVVVPGPHDMGHAEHVRFYTIADAPFAHEGHAEVSICVRRCQYLDEYSGERYEGVASKYLCELSEGAEVTLAGPIGLAFELPEDRNANLLLIGLGTGIAPFRSFLRHIYRNLSGWDGQVLLFHGARTGLELVYMNDHRNDIAEYEDEETFRAIEALSPRPHWDEPPALADALRAHEQEVWSWLEKPSTYVYVAGIEAVGDTLDSVLAEFAGSPDKWARRKAELIAGGRWTQVLY